MVAKAKTGELVGRFVPHEGHLALRAIKDNKTPGGLVLPEAVKTSSKTIVATVLRAGPNCAHYKTGDTVVVHGGAAVRQVELGWDDADKFVVVKEDQVIGRLDEAAAEVDRPA